MPAAVQLTPWSVADHDLLLALNGDPVQMAHVGGPETPEKIADRHARYARDPHQLRIAVDGAPAGWVGFWPREWGGAEVYEIGWSVLPAFQGRGVATQAALAAIAIARETDGVGGPTSLHAFPNTGNAPSNAVCRRAGFALVAEGVAFEYPPGTFEAVNDWRLDL